MQGKADQALVAAAVASFVGGTISVVLFTGFAPPLAAVALAFGSPEEFALMTLAFATFVGLGGDDIPKTLFSIFIGLALSAVGLDIVSGEPRLIFFDIPGFFHGINFLVLAIGIYGIGEILCGLDHGRGHHSAAAAAAEADPQGMGGDASPSPRGGLRKLPYVSVQGRICRILAKRRQAWPRALESRACHA